MKHITLPILGLLACCAVATADEPPAWTTAGPTVDEESISIEVPLDVLATKLFVEVELGGKPLRFVFDTGSPSMLHANLAAELGLETIDTRKGRDSHGAVVETRIVQSDLTVGGTTFRNVPIYVADFPKTARCLFDGVLGSELLPLCAWQLDLPDATLRCSSDAAKLDHVKNARRVALHDFGYPHLPFLDVGLAKDASSKAMFDTGSPEYLAISPPDLDGARRHGGVGRVVQGSGSVGGSLGGMAPQGDHHRVEIEALSVGVVELGRVEALVREMPPSLVGASLLEHFVVTLDAKDATAYFDPIRGGPFVRPSYGFGLDFEDVPVVSFVWSGSPADVAGLKNGHRVTSINGTATDASCDGIRRAMRAMSDGDTIAVEWDGGAATLEREPVFAE